MSRKTLLVLALAGAVVIAAGVLVVGLPGGGGGDDDDPAGAGVSVWAVGDAADGGEPAGRLADMIADEEPDLFLYLGDVYPNGTREDFAERYAPDWGPFKARTLPTPGNHEWANRRRGYNPYWRRPDGRTLPAYYAVRTGGWEILSLNSEAPHGPGSDQVRWLRRRVAGGGNCRLAFSHRPRFSAGSHGDAPDMAPLWNALRGRARLVVGAHDHNMQRLRDRDGIVELISGAGGRSHYNASDDDARLVFFNDKDFGALRLTLSPGVARFAFVDVDGRTLHSGTARCRSRGRG